MDDFERRLATSMKAAAEQMPSPESRVRQRRAGLIAVAASVVVASAIAGTTWLFNPGDSSGSSPASETEPSPNPYPTVPPTGDIAIWSLAPGQDLNQDSTEFTALVTRLGCNSGVTGQVMGPGVVITGSRVVVSFTVPPSPGGLCPGNDSVSVKVRLAEPLGGRALVDGQCTNTRASRTYFCEVDDGVRRPAASGSPGPIARDWQGELEALLTGANVKVAGAPEEPFNSGFIEGRLGDQQVLAILFDEPVRGLPGRLVRAVQLGNGTGGLYEAAARSYIEFRCGPTDRLQVSVLQSSGPLDLDRTTKLAEALAASDECQR